MKSMDVREYLRTHVLGLVAILIALTGTAIAQPGSGSTASSSAVSYAKFKKLQRRVAALDNKLSSPVGGDLAGTFPNLKIVANAVGTNALADNAVSTAKIAANTVTSTKIPDDAIVQEKLADNSVGANELKDLIAHWGTPHPVSPNSYEATFSGCAGEQALSGGGRWNQGDQDPALAIIASELNFNAWDILVSNQDSVSRTFNPIAFCLPE